MSDLDPFTDDEEEEAPEANPAQRRIDAKMKRQEKELEELRAFKAEQEAAQKQASVKEAFAAAELNPKWAGFFQGEEATPEAIKAWALENELIQPADEDAPVSEGYTPTVIEAPRPASAKTFTRQEMEEIARENPSRAQQLAEAGRVRWNNPQVADR